MPARLRLERSGSKLKTLARIAHRLSPRLAARAYELCGLELLNPVPEGFQIGVGEGHLFDEIDATTRFTRLVEPLPSLREVFQLRCVAGQVVGDGRHGWKLFERG